MEEEKIIKILYKNWKGETGIRNIIPKEIVFTSTEWHPEKQWCLVAYDIDKNADRTFACKDVASWNA